jgi:hypothetical protein
LSLEYFFESLLARSNSTSYYLLNEQQLSNVLYGKRLCLAEVHSSTSFLQTALHSMNSIIASWPNENFLQFQNFLFLYRLQFNQQLQNPKSTNSLSLVRFWAEYYDKRLPFPFPKRNYSSETSRPLGVITHETVKYHILIIPKNKVLGIHSDMLCGIFHNEFTSAYEELAARISTAGHDLLTFGKMPVHFFPQLTVLDRPFKNSKNQTKKIELSNIVIKYTTHREEFISSHYSFLLSRKTCETVSASSWLTFPEMISPTRFQTLGAFNAPALIILAK